MNPVFLKVGEALNILTQQWLITLSDKSFDLLDSVHILLDYDMLTYSPPSSTIFQSYFPNTVR